MMVNHDGITLVEDNDGISWHGITIYFNSVVMVSHHHEANHQHLSASTTPVKCWTGSAWSENSGTAMG